MVVVRAVGEHAGELVLGKPVAVGHLGGAQANGGVDAGGEAVERGVIALDEQDVAGRAAGRHHVQVEGDLD